MKTIKFKTKDQFNDFINATKKELVQYQHSLTDILDTSPQDVPYFAKELKDLCKILEDMQVDKKELTVSYNEVNRELIVFLGYAVKDFIIKEHQESLEDASDFEELLITTKLMIEKLELFKDILEQLDCEKARKI